jgi:two-component system sensor histidine kinase DesK
MDAERTMMEGVRERALSAARPRQQSDGLQGMIAASGISPRLWRLYAGFWLICLVFPILALVQARPALLQLLLATIGLVVFVIVYLWIMWPHPLQRGAKSGLSPAQALLLLAGLTTLVLLLSFSSGSAFLWLTIGVGAIAGVTLPARSAFVAVMFLTLLVLAIAVGLSGGVFQTDWLHILPLALVVRGLGLDMIGLARLSDTLQELHAARGELARLAVMEERLRLARDLHDLLGQTLSAIALKSELASRLIDRAPAQAALEIQAVEGLARQTLREVREAVAGYRQPELRRELDSARELLAAAGIDGTVEHTAGALPPAIDAMLAWAIREGVTNVIRHSRARRCLIQVMRGDGLVCAEIVNDGAHGRGQEDADHKHGTGLAGLAERAGTLGGRITAELYRHDGQLGFRLRVALPLRGAVAGQEPA